MSFGRSAWLSGKELDDFYGTPVDRERRMAEHRSQIRANELRFAAELWFGPLRSTKRPLPSIVRPTKRFMAGRIEP